MSLVRMESYKSGTQVRIPRYLYVAHFYPAWDETGHSELLPVLVSRVSR